MLFQAYRIVQYPDGWGGRILVFEVSLGFVTRLF